MAKRSLLSRCPSYILHTITSSFKTYILIMAVLYYHILLLVYECCRQRRSVSLHWCTLRLGRIAGECRFSSVWLNCCDRTNDFSIRWSQRPFFWIKSSVIGSFFLSDQYSCLIPVHLRVLQIVAKSAMKHTNNTGCWTNRVMSVRPKGTRVTESAGDTHSCHVAWRPCALLTLQ